MLTEESLLTVAGVNQRLPLVRSIVRDIVELHSDLTRRRARLQELRERHPAGTKADPVYEAEVQAMEAELLLDEQKMGRYTGELQQIGGELTNAAVGRVDFPAELDGDRVSLCWTLDEPEVIGWHATACGEGPRMLLSELPEDCSIFGQASLPKG